MNDTPKTDAIVRPFIDRKEINPDEVDALLDHARNQERQIARLTKENESMSAACGSFANINDTCRARGFEAGPSGRSTEDRVIALAQAYDRALDALRQIGAKMENGVWNVPVSFFVDEDRDVLKEQNRILTEEKARLRDALVELQRYHDACEIEISPHWEFPTLLIEKALATP